MKFTIRCDGLICGTYNGATDAEALENYAKDSKFASFADLCQKQNLTRDNFKCEKVS